MTGLEHDDAIRAYRLLSCGHPWPLYALHEGECEQCEANNLYLEEMIANAVARAAVRSQRHTEAHSAEARFSTKD